MSEKQKDTAVSPDNDAMPGEPAATDEITTLNNAMPSEPATADEKITTLNNAMPAGPVFDLDGK
jgi:hypothetical protein